jgi:hypothetical protein
MFARPVLVIVAAVLAGSLHASLAFLVSTPSHYRFFPPFEPGQNRNEIQHLGGEYYNIAGALTSGRGYADPFPVKSGPTAWMPPVLAYLLPYALISYYDRYKFPLLGVEAALLLFGLDRLWFRPRSDKHLACR